MPTKNHNLLLHRAFQYATIVLIVAAMGGGYWYWKQAQAGVTQKTANNQGLVGYWSFDDGAGTQAGDASGNGNTGTLTNMDPATDWVDGKLGKALDFDGTNDYADAGSGNSLRISGAFSMSFWMYGRGSSTDAYIAGTAGTNFEGYSCTHHNGSTVYCYIQSGTNYVNATVGNNAWTNITVTWDGTTGTNGKKLYTNGVLQSQGTSSYSALSGWGNFRIGEDATATRTRFNGNVDELRVFNRALEATEIANLYALGAAKLQKTQSSDLTNGLVGYWPFNGKDVSGTTAYDRSGQGNNGTLTNSPAVTEGKSGQALSFNGTNQYVSVASLLGSPANITISAWINQSASNSGEILSVGNRVAIRSTADANGIAAFFYDGSTYPGTITGKRLDGQGWHLVTYVMNDSSDVQKVYIDGVESQSTSHAASIVYTGGSNVTIGVHPDLSQFKYSGSIDEPRVYNRALSASEIWNLYQLGVPDKVNSADSQGDSLEKGMVGYWKLDDASGTSASDASGNGNTGTLTNGPTWTAGRIGGATSFDGTNDYIELGSSAKIDNSSQGTISFWMNYGGDIEGSGVPTIFSYGGGVATNAGRFNIRVRTSGGAKMHILQKSNGEVTDDSVLGSTTLSIGQWYHVAVSSDGATYKIYLNGSQETLSALTGSNSGDWFSDTTVSETDKTLLGNRYSNGVDDATHFLGSLDEFRIYNRILSSEEIVKLYKTTAPDDPDTGLAGYWPFNGPDISGTTAYDRSGKGNSGTLTNGPTVTEGKSGQALNFDGSDDYIAYGARDFGSIFTISLWVNPLNTGSSLFSDTLVANASSGCNVNGFRYFLNTYNSNDGKIIFETGNGSACDTAAAPAGTITNNQWNHLVVVVNKTSGTATIYKDGVIVNSADTSIRADFQVTSAWNLGVNVGCFKGSIDEPRIYNRALTQAEVTALYNAGR